MCLEGGKINESTISGGGVNFCGYKGGVLRHQNCVNAVGINIFGGLNFFGGVKFLGS